MAKKQVDLSKLTLGAARPVIKTAPQPEPVAEVEKAVEAIHQPAKPTAPVAESAPGIKKGRGVATAPTKNAPEAPSKPVVEKEKRLGKRGRPVLSRDEDIIRVSVDLPKSLYKLVKTKVVQEEITLFEYFAKLAEKDLKG